jgi:hypothetical protein
VGMVDEVEERGMAYSTGEGGRASVERGVETWAEPLDAGEEREDLVAGTDQEEAGRNSGRRKGRA